MKGHGIWLGAWLVLLFLAGSSGGGVWALTDEEIFRDFRFNFVNPGARALGMGGAFIAAGDDATAAQSNPAALHYVTYKEIFAEYRQVKPETQFFAPDRAFGDADPSTSNRPFLDAQSVNNREDTSSPTFVSFAYPFELARRRARVAVSRQTVLNVKSSLADGDFDTNFRLALNDDDFPVWVNPTPSSESCGQLAPVEVYSVCNKVSGDLDAELIHYNLGFAYGITQDFTLGVTLTYATLDMMADVYNESQDPRGVLTSIHPRVMTSGGLAPLHTMSSIDDTDNAFTYTIGVLWHPDRVFPNRANLSPIRFGLVYRKGADLAVEETTFEQDTSTNRFTVKDQFPNTLRVPDRFGIGVSYEAWDHWTFALDVERIQYSDLLEGYRAGENFFTSPALPKGPTLNINPDDLEFDVDDATVVHAGVEFSMISQGNWTQAVRAGYFNAPDNRIRLVSIDSGDPQVDRLYKKVFSGGSNENHYTAGFSIGTPIGIQLQLGADFSESAKEYVVSAIYRFGKVF